MKEQCVLMYGLGKHDEIYFQYQLLNVEIYSKAD